jgi:hypothetical protein
VRRSAGGLPSEAGSAAYAVRVRGDWQSMIDDRMWLRFDDRPFTVGDTISPRRPLPPHWQDLYQRDEFCLDRVYIVRAAGPGRVARASWNDPQRRCYQVDPELPLQRDPDPTHLDIFDSWTCPTTTVISVLREPRIT